MVARMRARKLEEISSLPALSTTVSSPAIGKRAEHEQGGQRPVVLAAGPHGDHAGDEGGHRLDSDQRRPGPWRRSGAV